MKKQVNICKNFTDVAAFIACLIAAITLFFYKKEFEPTEELTSFLDIERNKAYLTLAVGFFASGLINALSRRLPTLSLPVSVIPLWLSFYFFSEKLLEKRPLFYIIYGLIHFCGALIYFFQWYEDNPKPMRSCHICACSSVALAFVSVCIWGLSSLVLIVKYEIMLRPLFYIFLAMGIFLGIAGVAWAYIAKGAGNTNTKTPALRSISASLVCLIIWIIRYNVAIFGF